MSEHGELSPEIYFTFLGEWKFIPVSYWFVLSESFKCSSAVCHCHRNQAIANFDE